MKGYKWVSKLEIFRQRYTITQSKAAKITGYSLRQVVRVESADYRIPLPMLKLVDIYTITQTAQKTIDDIIKAGDSAKYISVDNLDILKLCFRRIQSVLETKYISDKVSTRTQRKKSEVA